MAVVNGPLFSMDASNQFGGALVFQHWKGRNTVRQLVRPANPMTLDQVEARNKIRVTGAIQHWIYTAATTSDGSTDTDKERIIAVTPAGFAWNGYITDILVGSGALSWAAAEAAYTALTSPQKTAWDTAGAALTPAYADVAQFVALNAAGTAFVKGKVFFFHRYAMYLMGIASVPGGTPPTYS